MIVKLFDVKSSTVLPLIATDILYPMILVPGRVNGGLHVILTVEELMKE